MNCYYTIEFPRIMKAEIKMRNGRMRRQKQGLAVEEVKNELLISWAEMKPRRQVDDLLLVVISHVFFFFFYM